MVLKLNLIWLKNSLLKFQVSQNHICLWSHKNLPNFADTQMPPQFFFFQKCFFLTCLSWLHVVLNFFKLLYFFVKKIITVWVHSDWRKKYVSICTASLVYSNSSLVEELLYAAACCWKNVIMWPKLVGLHWVFIKIGYIQHEKLISVTVKHFYYQFFIILLFKILIKVGSARLEF